jgi:hypothetical protein
MRNEKSYAEKLRDPRWQRKRLEILEAAGFACEECKATDKTLHVHHVVYTKGLEPWEYYRRELIVLCEDCHEIRGSTEHDLKLEFGRLLRTLTIEQMSSLMPILLSRTNKYDLSEKEEAEILNRYHKGAAR